MAAKNLEICIQKKDHPLLPHSFQAFLAALDATITAWEAHPRTSQLNPPAPITT
jgi:hypothetical protein